MDSTAATIIKTRMSSPMTLTGRERIATYIFQIMAKDMSGLAAISSLTPIVTRWSFSRGPSHAQFRQAAAALAAESGLDFNADTFDKLDSFRNKNRGLYDSMPYTRVCDMIDQMRLTRLKAYALISHWNHHKTQRDNLFESLDDREKRVMVKAEKQGVTAEYLEIQKQIKSTNSAIAALDRKLTPAKTQLLKYQTTVEVLESEMVTLLQQRESLETQAKKSEISL